MAATVRDIIEIQGETEIISHTPTNKPRKGDPAESVETRPRPSSDYNEPEALKSNGTRPDDNAQYPGGWRLTAIMVSLCLGTLLVAIDNTIIGVAIPKISTAFDALDDIGWYGSVFPLTVTALQPTFGNIYRYFDVKITYVVSIVVFESEWKALRKLEQSIKTE